MLCVSPTRGYNSAMVDEEAFANACIAVQHALSSGIRTVRSSSVLVKTVYTSTYRACLLATEIQDETKDRLQTLYRKLCICIERDLYQLCVRSCRSMNEWVKCLYLANFVKIGYQHCVLPYNHAVSTFGHKALRTDAIVDNWICKLLREYNTQLNGFVHELFTSYVGEIHNTSVDEIEQYTSCIKHVMDQSHHRNILQKWLNILNTLQTDSQQSYSISTTTIQSVIPTATMYWLYTGFTSLHQGFCFLIKWFEAEQHHCTLMHRMMGTMIPHSRENTMNQFVDQFKIEREYHRMMWKLKSVKPENRKPSLFYDQELFDAILRRDLVAIQKYLALFCQLPLHLASAFESSFYVDMIFEYGKWSLVEQKLTGLTLRTLWNVLNHIFQNHDQNDCFPADEHNSEIPAGVREGWCMLSKSIIKRLYLTSRLQLHVLLPWLTEIMDPTITDLTWKADMKWWTALFHVAEDREHLIQQYLDISLKPRIVLGEINEDDEMELLVCLSVEFNNHASRALQNYRMLLTPYSIKPDLGCEVDTYLVPTLTWKDVPTNAPQTCLHPCLSKPLQTTIDDYHNKYFKEREIQWSHWYSRARICLQTEDDNMQKLDAPLFAVHLIAVLIELSEVSESIMFMQIVKQSYTPYHDDKETKLMSVHRLYISFWLNWLTTHNIICSTPIFKYESVYSYKVNKWTGCRYVPLPDPPTWWHVITHRQQSKTPLDTLANSNNDEYMMTKKEHLECAIIHLLKQADGPMAKDIVCDKVQLFVSPYIAVLEEDIEQSIKGLIDREYLCKCKDDRLTYIQ